MKNGWVTLLGLLFVSFVCAQDYQSKCHLARIVGGQTDNSHTCGFNGPATAGLLPSWFTNGGEAGADSETYNGFPFLSSPKDIPSSGTGTGAGCGECFEVTGITGVTKTLMISDVCDKACCDDCQGSLGGVNGPADIQEFGIKNKFVGDNSFYSSITGISNAGAGLISYRKVACPLEGRSIGFYLTIEAREIHFFNYRVGIKSVYIKQNNSNTFVQITREWTNKFTIPTLLSFPVQWKIESIYGENITTQSVAQSEVTTPFFNTTKQFTVIADPNQFKTPFAGSCPWPGPPKQIYKNGAFQGENIIKWGVGIPPPATVQSNNKDAAAGCTNGCIFMPSGSITTQYYSPTIFGRNLDLSNSTTFKGIQFDVRSKSGNITTMKVGWQKWKCGDTNCFNVCPGFTVPPFGSTSWTTVKIDLDQFTWTGVCADRLVGFFNFINAPGDIYINNIQFYGGATLRDVALPNPTCANGMDAAGNMNLPCSSGTTTTGIVSTTAAGTTTTTGNGVTTSSTGTGVSSENDGSSDNGAGMKPGAYLLSVLQDLLF